MSTNSKYREFIEVFSELSSSPIKKRMQNLPTREQLAVRRFALRVLDDPKLKKNEKLRSGAVRLVVALLPGTFPVLKVLLADCSSPVWYEVQFTIFSALDRDDLRPADQTRVLEMIHEYVVGIRSGAGYAAWKAGDLLGDEWRDPQTVKMLEHLLFSARHAAGRKAALHGIQHVLKESSLPERKRLFSLIQRVAKEDRSASVRLDARLTLEGVGCGPRPEPSE